MMTIPSEPLEPSEHGIVPRGRKPGKVQKIREYEQWLKEYNTRDIDIYAAWIGSKPISFPCFSVYSCGDRSDCLGYVEDDYYTLVCYHCLEQKIKEKEKERID